LYSGAKNLWTRKGGPEEGQLMYGELFNLWGEDMKTVTAGQRGKAFAEMA